MSALVAALAGPAIGQQIADDPTGPDIDVTTLAAYLDILLPADDMSPAASALGVQHDLVDFTRDNAQLRQFLAMGTAWLNDTGRGPFHALPQDDQARVVEWMSRADRDTPPGRFFLLVRLAAVEFYYSKGEVAASFGLNTAPQPAGYPPPWQ